MSLAAFALRLSAIQALRGATYAGERVFDSTIDPIDFLAQQERQPFIVVSTEDEEADIEGRDLLYPSRKIALLIEFGLASKVDAGDIDIPHTDAGLEASLNIMHRQIMRALTIGGAWADLFREFSPRIEKLVSRRMADAPKQGARFALRQVVLTCDTLADPDYGAAPEAGTAWARLLSAMDGDPELADFATVLRDAIIGDPLPSWRRRQAALGISEAGLAAIGLAPVFEHAAEDQEPAAATEATLDGMGVETTISDGSTEEFEAWRNPA